MLTTVKYKSCFFSRIPQQVAMMIYIHKKAQHFSDYPNSFWNFNTLKNQPLTIENLATHKQKEYNYGDI